MTQPARSFTITIRPKLGLSVKTEEDVLKYLEKQHHAFAVIEGEDESRHLHGQVWLKNPRKKGDFNKSIERICERTIDDWTPAQLLVLRGGTKYAYNDDFVENYCQKEENPEIIFNNPPAGDTSEYYPSEEDQNKIQAKANAVDKKFHNWETKFHEWYTQDRQVRLGDVARWMSHAMFKEKSIQVIVDKKNRVQNCKSLYLYINSKHCPEEFMTEAEYKNHLEVVESEMAELGL